MPKFKLAILNSHPIQYFAPLYQRLAEEDSVDLTVYYCSKQGIQAYQDKGFGVSVKWDVPLLDNYNVRFLTNLRTVDQVGGFFSLINPTIVRELQRERFDALWVHGHNYWTYLVAILAARVLGIPVLMRCETHLMLHRSAVKTLIRRIVMTPFYRWICSACMPIGKLNHDFYRKHGVPDEHLFLVPYTVNNRFFIEKHAEYLPQRLTLQAEYGFLPDLPIILYASKLLKRKHPFDLLRAYHRLSKKGLQAQLVFVGSGDEEPELKKYVNKYAVPNVHFLGFRNQTELPKFYACADIFVLPAQDEPWGLVLNEAMCAKLPIVATNEIGAVPDLIFPNENGFIFQVGDLEALSKHLSILIKDAKLRARMGEKSRHRINEWGYDDCVQGIIAALNYVSRKNQ